MKRLLNIVVFSSMFFVALTRENNLYASERNYLKQNFFSDTVRGRMIFDNPGSTLGGAYLIGSDIIRSLRGRSSYLLAVAGDRVNYFFNGELMKTIQKQSLLQVRRRNLGAFLLGYSCYKANFKKDF